jgi:hypothetical protein
MPFDNQFNKTIQDWFTIHHNEEYCPHCGQRIRVRMADPGDPNLIKIRDFLPVQPQFSPNDPSRFKSGTRQG